jgi:exosortase K
MNNKNTWRAQLFVVGLCSLALKLHYSLSSPDELRWILSPTTWLVELLSGRAFNFESHAGYMSSDHTFLIAAPCAGVNFLIAAFLMLSLRVLLSPQYQKVSWRFLPVTAAMAYASTIIANTVRICIALEMQKDSLHSELLDGGQLHRLEGIVVYFAFLLVLFIATEQRPNSGFVQRLRHLCFPLGVYYTTALLVPLMNGAFRRGPIFWEHSLFVMLVPILVSLLVLSVCVVSDLTRRRVSTCN